MGVNLLSQLIPQRLLFIFKRVKELLKMRKYTRVKIYCICHLEYLPQMLKQRSSFSQWSFRELIRLGCSWHSVLSNKELSCVNIAIIGKLILPYAHTHTMYVCIYTHTTHNAHTHTHPNPTPTHTFSIEYWGRVWWEVVVVFMDGRGWVG